MYKETAICIITIIVIVILNLISGNYTKESVNELTKELSELRSELLKEDVDNAKVQAKINYVFEIWKNRYNILAYYLEHDELEKVETNLNSISGEIETKEYSEAISELDRTNFILNHIEKKNKFELENLF